MGIGTNILGYANTDVDNAVSKRLYKANMTTLNCAEEVELAEKLIKIHPWASQVRFARSGGEANAIAVRLARSYTKNKKLLFVVIMDGMIGIGNKFKKKSNLNEHLLPGLKTGGVLKKLSDSIFLLNIMILMVY